MTIMDSFKTQALISTCDIKHGQCSCCKQIVSGIETKAFQCKFCEYKFKIILCGSCHNNLYKKIVSYLPALNHDKEHISVELV